NGQWLDVTFPAVANVQYIRVVTTVSPSDIAWFEIEASNSTTTSTPGIIFTGDGSASFGQGQASTTDWIVGGAAYPEVYTASANSSVTSYQYLLNKATRASIPITNLTSFGSCSNLANCTLPPNLANGIYQANGDVNLNAYSFRP